MIADWRWSMIADCLFNVSPRVIEAPAHVSSCLRLFHQLAWFLCMLLSGTVT
jgi:hypothetical protein